MVARNPIPGKVSKGMDLLTELQGVYEKGEALARTLDLGGEPGRQLALFETALKRARLSLTPMQRRTDSLSLFRSALKPSLSSAQWQDGNPVRVLLIAIRSAYLKASL